LIPKILKTLLLRSALIFCLLFLGLKNAEAFSTLTETTVTDGTSSPVYQGQTGIAMFSFSVTGGGNSGTPIMSSLAFTGSTTISNYFSNAKLYVNTTANNFAAAVPVTTGATGTIAGTSLTFTGLNESIARGDVNYYYLVVDFTGASAVPATFTFNMNTTGNNPAGMTSSNAFSVTLNDRTGNPYTLSARSLAVASITAGLTGTTLTASQNNVALFGASLTSSGSNSFTALTFTTTSTAPVGSNIITYFPAVTLYSSSSATFDGTAAPVTGATYSTLSATSLTVTLPTAKTLTNGGVTYYYLVANYTEPATTATYKFSLSTVTGATTTGTPAAGQVYTLTAPSLAEAQITAGLAPTTLTASQNAISVYGISLKATGNASFSALNFTTTSTPGVNISTYFPSVQLYSSLSPTFDGTATAVSGAVYSTLGATTLGITGLTETINNGVTKYYYLVVNYVEPSTSGTFAFNTPTVTGSATTGTAAGQTYNLKAPSLAEAPIIAGLAPTTLTASQNAISVYGISLKATGNASFSALNFTTTSTVPAGANIGTYFPSVQLYSSSNPTFDGTATAVSGAVYSALTATTLGITGLTETINDGVTKYYYLVVNYTEPTATNPTFTFNSPTITGSATTGTAAGQTYNLKAPVLAEAPITAGLAPTTLTLSQNNISVYGISLKATGNASFSALNFTTTSTPGVNLSAYFSSVQLYSSSNPAFDGTATAVSGATYSALTATTFAVTSLTETINDGVTKYYYLVVNYVEPTTTSGTFAFNTPTVTGAATTGAAAGQTYNFKASSLAAAPITAGLAPTSLTLNQNGIAIFGMSLKSTGNNTFTALNFNTTTAPAANIGDYFSSVTLYSSSNATFDGTATAVSGATYSALNANTLAVTGLSETINDGATKYYYLVVNYVEPSVTGTFAFSSPTITGATTTGAAAGQTYTLNAASLAETAITAGLAPTTLTASQNGIAVFGMALKATGNNSFTDLNFTTTSTLPAGSNISTYFSSVQLYSSSSATFDGTATAVSGATYSALTATTLAVSGLTETISDGATKYYYLVVNYVEPATTATFKFNSPTITGATTTGAAAGQVYTLTAPSVVEASITAGLAGTTLLTSQTGISVFGMSLKATGTASFSALSFTTTSTTPVGSNINAYFPSIQLYSSSSATFDGTATAVSGATYSALSATTLNITGLSETINDGVTKYYYLVVNYTEPATTGTFKFNSPTITGVTATGTAAGQVYTCTAPSLAETAITAGLAATTLTASQTSIGVFGMSLKATGDATFNTINFTTTSVPTANINAYFSSVQLYSSSSATFDGTATAVSGATYSTLNATTLAVTGLSEAISNGATKYYYLVVNYVEPNTTGTIKFTVSTIATAANTVTTTGAAAGQTYTCTAPSLTQAQITAGLATSPLTVSQTGIAVYGMSLKAVGTASVTALKFTTTSTAPVGSNISTYFPSVQLYSSTSNTFNGTATPVSGAVYSPLAATTLNITGLTETINDGVTRYYYLVVNYTQPLTSATYQFSLSTVTGTPTTIGGAAGINYTITAPTLTQNQTTGGLYTPPTITNSQTNIALSGISLVSANGPSTVTFINYTATQNIGTYFSGNVNLYRSASATFSMATATLVTSIAAPASPNITFPLTGANQTITATPVYYYLVMDANILPTATTTFEFDVNTLTTSNTTTYTDKTGTQYTLTAPTITENQTTGGLFPPTNIVGSQTNLALSGISLVSVNGNTTATFINYTATRNLSTYFSGNVNLYKSASATFSMGTATLVTSTAVPNSASISFALTGANQTITATPVYYYLVFDANIVPTTTTSFEMDVNTVTSGFTVNYTDKTGTGYSLVAPTITVTQTTGGLYTPTTISGNQTNLPLSGVVLTSTNGNSTVTAINYTATQNISTYFSGNVNFYRSTSATFSTGTATLITSTAVPNSTNITFNIPLANQTVAAGTPVYYYLVMDANIPPTASTTFEWDVNTLTTPNTPAYTDRTGTSYTLSPAVTLGTATTTGLAANPLNYSQTGIGIYGFSITTTASQTFNQFTFTATQTIGTYFSNVQLYSNTTNSFNTATPVSGVTVSNLNSTTLTLSGLSQTVNPGAPKYYFIVVDYTDPATATTFQLNVKNVITATTTYTNGTPVAGTIYNLGPVTYDWTGTATPVGGLYPWTTPGNWRVNGATSTTYPGQNGATNDIVNIGVNVTFSHQPNLSANVTVASMFFGYDGPQSNYQTTPNTLVLDNIILTVNTGSTLTVTGNITQNHDASAAGSNFNFSVTTFAGLGTLICQGNLLVGDAVTQPAFTVAVVTQVTSQINQLTINGNLILTTNGNGNPSPAGNRGICYAYFSLEKGTTKILKQIKFSTNNNPLASLFDTYNPGITAYQGYGLFTVDKTTSGSGPCTLELPNIQPIIPADKFYVHFTYGGNNGTVLYDDPNAGDSQVIYTANEPSATTTQTYIGTTSPNCYYNLAFAGPSTKVVDPNSTLTISGGSTVQGLTMGGTWTTDGGIVDLRTNDPTVIVGGAWNNTTTINHDAGPITVGGMFSNNVSGDASGTLNCGTADITFKGGYTNNATFVANATGNINFTPATAETITDNSTFGTTFNNVNFTSGTTTINAGISTIGNIAVSNVGKLKMSGTAKLVAGTLTSGGTGYLTLMSDAVSTATAYTPSGTSITGNVNVQRWITGGSGYRGYRLFSSPVNVSLNTGGSGNLALGYLGANGKFANNTYLGAFTEGPGTGFTYNGSFNPIIYLYDETRPSTNQGFTAGKNIGIYSITGNTVTTLTSNVQQAGVSIPVGNSYLLYYVGDNHLTDQTAVLTTRIPESTPVTATGYLNQGNVVVSFWKNNSTTIPYDVNGGNLPGLNQVGNPYASTIKLSQFYTDNTATGISPQFWVLDATTGLSGTYVSYNASSGATSSTKAGNYVVSGQGFLVQATGTGSGANLTFKEDQKVDYPAITSTSGAPNGALVMSIPSSPGVSNSDVIAKSFAQINPVATGSVLTGLHLQLSKDTTAYTQTGVYFSTQWSDAYNAFEDAMDLDGATPKVYLSSYSSDGKRLSINELGDYGAGKRVKLYAGATSSGAYSISLADFVNMDTTGYNIFLIDKKLNDSVDLVRNKSYAFTINNSDTSTYGANRFVLAIEHAAVPPYALNSFTGNKVAAGVLLTWLTTNASNYTGYILQKQNTDGSYSNLFSTQSDNGETKYSYIDQNPIVGANTYRLAQNDVFNNTTYSAPLTVMYTKGNLAKVGLSIFPNPSNSIVNVIYTDRTNTNPSPNYTVDIFNAAGTFIKHEAINTNSWTENISSFKLGVYLLQLKDSNGNLVGQTKFIKNL